MNVTGRAAILLTHRRAASLIEVLYHSLIPPSFHVSKAGADAMNEKFDWCVVIPLANEEACFEEFVRALGPCLDDPKSGVAYLVVDSASTDRTLDLVRELAARDPRFIAVWAPENRSVVDAYLRGLREAQKNGHSIIAEMDAGLSHDPRSLKDFISAVHQGAPCAFGFRFQKNESRKDSTRTRRCLSKAATVSTNLLLGTSFQDATSGFQAFSKSTLERILKQSFRSKAHFYHAEMKYLLRGTPYREIPIRYRDPSPRVSWKAVEDSIKVLLLYFGLRLRGKSPKGRE